jgi:hypothetical protein
LDGLTSGKYESGFIDRGGNAVFTAEGFVQRLPHRPKCPPIILYNSCAVKRSLKARELCLPLVEAGILGCGCCKLFLRCYHSVLLFAPILIFVFLARDISARAFMRDFIYTLLPITIKYSFNMFHFQLPAIPFCTH